MFFNSFELFLSFFIIFEHFLLLGMSLETILKKLIFLTFFKKTIDFFLKNQESYENSKSRSEVPKGFALGGNYQKIHNSQ